MTIQVVSSTGACHVTNDIVKAVIKAMQINDDVCGSPQNFLSILQYGIAREIVHCWNFGRAHGKGHCV